MEPNIFRCWGVEYENSEIRKKGNNRQTRPMKGSIKVTRYLAKLKLSSKFNFTDQQIFNATFPFLFHLTLSLKCWSVKDSNGNRKSWQTHLPSCKRKGSRNNEETWISLRYIAKVINLITNFNFKFKSLKISN